MVDEDVELRAVLETLGPEARADLLRTAEDDPAAFFRALAQRPDLADLTHLLAMTDDPSTARLRVLRVLRDLERG